MKKTLLIFAALSLSPALAQQSVSTDVVTGNCKALVVERSENLISVKVAVAEQHLGVFQKTVSSPYRLECKNLQLTLSAGEVQVKTREVSDRFSVPVVGAFSFNYFFDKDFSWKP